MPRQTVLPTFNADYHVDLPRLLHAAGVLDRAHRHVVLRELERHAPDCVLPERTVVLRTVQGNQNRHVLAEVDDALVLLETWRSDAHVWVSADDEAVAVAIADEIKGRLPRTDDERRVDVSFTDATTGTRTLTIDVRPWPEARDGYPAEVQAARLLGRPVDRPMTLAEVMSTAPVQTPTSPVAVGQYL